MNLPQRRTVARRGFTLVEILVVIAIIAVLIALLTPAVMSMLVKGPQVVTVNEIGQLDAAVQNFKSTYNVKYIPSRIKLCEKRSYYTLTGTPGNLDDDSVAFILQVWNSPTFATNWNTIGIDWSNTGIHATKAAGTWILEGDQCLVFFLGGIPLTGPAGCFGFATATGDPVSIGQTTGRKGPFFAFETGRLKNRVGGNPFYSYYDPWLTKPYAYFSNYDNGPNGYERYLDTTGRVIDCQGLGVAPYYERTNPKVYQNKTTHQIISAGADMNFGAGGTAWTKATAGSVSTAGQDDQANFNGGRMLKVGDQ
jgi:prepilin-type N-terminal cleavage/methylation domain-containing protein